MKQMHINFKVWGIGLLFAVAMTACDNEIPEIQQNMESVKTQIGNMSSIKATVVKQAEKKKTDNKKDSKKKTVVRTTVKY